MTKENIKQRMNQIDKEYGELTQQIAQLMTKKTQLEGAFMELKNLYQTLQLDEQPKKDEEEENKNDQ